MGKQFRVTLPDGFVQAIEDHAFALGEGGTAADALVFCVNHSLGALKRQTELLKSGKQLNCESFASLVVRHWMVLSEYERLSLDRLKQFRDGEAMPDELEVCRIAMAIGVSEREVEEVIERSSDGNSGILAEGLGSEASSRSAKSRSTKPRAGA